jgi:hypothetical protein
MHFWERRFLDAGVVRYQAEFNGVFVLEGSGPSAKASSGKPYAGTRMFGGALNDRVTNSFGLVVRPDKPPVHMPVLLTHHCYDPLIACSMMIPARWGDFAEVS